MIPFRHRNPVGKAVHHFTEGASQSRLGQNELRRSNRRVRRSHQTAFARLSQLAAEFGRRKYFSYERQEPSNSFRRREAAMRDLSHGTPVA